MSADELEVLKTQVADIHNCILGDFKSEGLLSRVVKLETSLKTSIGFLKGLGGIVVALIIAYLKMLLGL
jgi:hypothetical protein